MSTARSSPKVASRAGTGPYMSTALLEVESGPIPLSKTCRADTPRTSLGKAFEKQPEQKRKRGSASVALGIGSPFDQYLFVERDEGRAAQLRDLVTKEHEE